MLLTMLTLNFFRVLTFTNAGELVSLPQSGILKPGLHRLVIDNVTRQLEGRYICQVSGELCIVRHSPVIVLGDPKQAALQN